MRADSHDKLPALLFTLRKISLLFYSMLLATRYPQDTIGHSLFNVCDDCLLVWEPEHGDLADYEGMPEAWAGVSVRLQLQPPGCAKDDGFDSRHSRQGTLS
jgi:hypothetical protein